MNLIDLSRCTGFPPAVLQSFADRGILHLAPTPPTSDDWLFDGQAFLRALVESKYAK